MGAYRCHRMQRGARGVGQLSGRAAQRVPPIGCALGVVGDLRPQAEAPIIISPLVPIGQTAAGALLATRLLESSGVYIRYIVYPARDMYAVIRSPSRSAVQRIALSASEIPVGYVVVPELRDLTPKGALAEIREIGLTGRVAHNSGIVLPRLLDVVNQTPARGLVVAEGSRVMVSVIPADPPG